MFTQFWDMHSGGGTKQKPYEMIYIEAPIDEACVIFYNRFGHNPHRITCTCCGNDYSVTEYETLEEATDYQREDYRTKDKQPLDEYVKKPDVLVIYANEIQPHERVGELPEQGYVWIG